MAEEERCVLVVTQSLEQLSQRLQARPTAHPSSDEGSEGVVTVSEGAQFVALLDTVVNATGPTRTRELTLSLQPQLVPTLVSLLNSESLLSSIEEPNSAAIINQICNFMLHTTQIRDSKTPGVEGNAIAAAQDIAQSITQAGGVDALLKVSLSASHEEIYAAAAQTLYSILRVSPHAKQRMTDEGIFKILVRSLGEDTVASRRHILALCLREVVNAEPFTVASSAEAVLVLVRAFSLDENPDIQVAAGESLEMLFKADSEQWRTFGRKRELAQGIIGILEKGVVPTSGNDDDSSAVEVAVTALRLLETAVRCEGCCADTDAHFFVPFLKSLGDRHLARHHMSHGKVAALAARCLRLVVEFAPPASGLGVALMNDQSALSAILEGLLTASQAPPPSDDSDEGQQSAAVLYKVLCVEASYCISLILAQDPQSRLQFANHLSRDHSALIHVRSALVKGLNSAALEYYSECPILDVTGQVVNDTRSVEWDSTPINSTSSRPKQESIREVFEDQEERCAILIEEGERQAAAQGSNSNNIEGFDVRMQVVKPALSNLDKFFENLKENSDATSRLTFIMLSFATFTTLRPESADELNESGFPSSGSPRRAPAGVVQGILSSSVKNQNTNMIATAEQPAPTRASLLRQWSNNPRQREALEKAASAAAVGDTSLVTNPKPSTYVDVMMRRDPTAMAPTRLAGSPPRHHQHQGGGTPAPLQSSNAISLGLSQTPIKSYAFSKFDSALSLAVAFAQFYNKTGDPSNIDGTSQGGGESAKKSPKPKTVFETDGAFARRTATSSTSKGSASHYAAATPNAKAWGISQLKEGDLFYFSIPLSTVTTQALEEVQQRAVRHLKSIKDQFTVTPHAARARRWFLFDMLNNIMPGIITCLSELISLCDAHGEESVKFPLLLFAESQPGAGGHQATRGGSSSPGAIMERGTLHSGNLIDSTAQARFYFQSVTQQQQQQQARTLSSPVGALTAGEEASSTYLRDLERKISSLAEQRFSGHERTFPSISDDDDDDMFGGGKKPSTAMGNLLGRSDVVTRSRPNRRRGVGARSGIDRIGDDSD